MKWSTIATTVRTESVIGLFALTFTVANAPIFQNVGNDKASEFERCLTAAYFVGLMLTAICLVVARVTFEAYCPELIKAYPALDQYLGRVEPSSKEAIHLRSAMFSEWNDSNQTKANRLYVLLPVWTFIVLFPLSFLLGILSLLLFALR